MDDISQGIDSVSISDGGIAAAVACDMSTSKKEDMNSEKKCTSCKQNLDNVKTNEVEIDASANDMIESICVNCGKEGAKNTCNKCKQVKYCNAACKKRHRHKHKKDCEEHLKRVAELHDEKLFKQPQPKEDCPICFLCLPTYHKGWKYMACCGKIICSGCIHAPVYDDQGNKVDNQKCPFCRTPYRKTEEKERELKRVEANDPLAINTLGCDYRDGTKRHRDYTKALELFHRAGELGYTEAYTSIGSLYFNGKGVKVDEKKALHYFERAAIAGDVYARYNLGISEEDTGNFDRAVKHLMIAVRSGDNCSLEEIKRIYSDGHATKDDYTKSLRLYQEYLGEVKSRQRDEAAAFDQDYKYID